MKADTVEWRNATPAPLGAVAALWRRLSGARPAAVALDARTYGDPVRGRDLVAGRVLAGGRRLDAPGVSIWDLPAFPGEFQDFAWLDDLVAEGGETARDLARRWTWEWVARHGRRPPVAAPETAAQRLLRWLAHGAILVDGADGRRRAAFDRLLARQADRLARHPSGANGVAGLEARAAILLHALSRSHPPGRIDAASDALGRAAASCIGPDGGVASRSPADLARAVARLAEARAALDAAGRAVPDAVSAAIARAEPCLRALRMGDGTLARFHGGGSGAPGGIAQALSHGRPARPAERAMGFARLSARRTTLVLDAAAPPLGPGSEGAHASTLAFEMSSGRRRLVVNCGSGAAFGAAWRRAGRATPSHSTLAIDGYSSARLDGAEGADAAGAERLAAGPREVRVERRRDQDALGIIAAHDGYRESHGLTHMRRIDLGLDGRCVTGEDMLAAVERADERAFDRAMDEVGWQGVAFRLRFHLHPDVAVAQSRDAVTLGLPNGERWELRHTGAAALSIEASVYLEAGALAPRPARQVVLSAVALDYATRVGWTLAKTRETPDALRDLVAGDGPVHA